jgi:hypothetical protein
MKLARDKASELQVTQSKLSNVKDESTATQRMLLTDQAHQSAEVQALKLKIEQAELQLGEQVSEGVWTDVAALSRSIGCRAGAATTRRRS